MIQFLKSTLMILPLISIKETSHKKLSSFIDYKYEGDQVNQ